MIYLIGGSPRCGKTILAKQIAYKKRVPLISTDVIRQIVLHSTPKSEIKKKFPEEPLKRFKNKFLFEVYSPEKLLKAQIKEAETIWPGVKAFIEPTIRHKQDFIIEGIHLLPKLVKQFKGNKIWKNFRVVYLVKEDLDLIVNGFSKNPNKYDWMYPSIKNDKDRLLSAAKMVRIKGDYLNKEAIKYKFKIINTEVNFDKKLKQAQDYLIK